MRLIDLRLAAAAVCMLVATSSFSNPFLMQGSWFAGASIGLQNPHLDGYYTINNGSGFSPPGNMDSYSTQMDSTGVVSFDGGYRWQQDTAWIPAYALGLRYSHSFDTDIGRKITLFSLPDFTNYTYKWDIASDIFLLTAKINLFQWHHILPFLSGGAGVTFNTASNYQETALPGVTPRISPAFGRNTTSQFAYNLGVGVDWQVKPQWLVTLDYEYQNLGKVSSSSGVGTWAGSSLRSGTYHTGTVSLGFVYLI